MANASRISNAAAIAACDAIVDLLDAGSGAGYVEILNGTQPAGVDVAVTSQTVLATLTLGDPAFGAAADASPGATATANSITGDTSADATGTASWYRAYDSDDTAIIDGSVGTSDADMIMASTSITATEPVAITSWTVTMPES